MTSALKVIWFVVHKDEQEHPQEIRVEILESKAVFDALVVLAATIDCKVRTSRSLKIGSSISLVSFFSFSI
jgi:hypothetical protein